MGPGVRPVTEASLGELPTSEYIQLSSRPCTRHNPSKGFNAMRSSSGVRINSFFDLMHFKEFNLTVSSLKQSSGECELYERFSISRL